MNIGDRIIITHDNSYHGIPLGKVVPVVKIPVPYMVAVSYNDELHFPTSDEIAEIGKNDEVEILLQERDYKRFWWWLSQIPSLLAVGLLGVLSVAFLTIGERVVSDYTSSFVCVAFATLVIFLVRQKKREFEYKLIRK